jgi:hypothetical protein
VKIIIALLSLLATASCANGKEIIYTGSTPAASLIRSFLGISMNDSIDFIRWQLVLDGETYTLNCNYGIGKPNTNGFIDGGKKVTLKGALKKEKIIYTFQNGNNILRVTQLNENLIHLLDANNSLLVGNGGWSYTLNNSEPVITDEVNIIAQPSLWKDSIAFEGRTPCNVPGVIPEGMQCYKLKWYIILYAGNENSKTGTYRVFGTPYRSSNGKTGNWKIITGKNDRVIYQMNDDNGNGFLYLLKLDEHILVFTDAQGKLLTGNKDFSYTLNRRM